LIEDGLVMPLVSNTVVVNASARLLAAGG